MAEPLAHRLSQLGSSGHVKVGSGLDVAAADDDQLQRPKGAAMTAHIGDTTEDPPTGAIPEGMDISALFGQLIFARRQFAEMWGRVALTRRLIDWDRDTGEPLDLKQAVDDGYAAWITSFPAVWALQQHLHSVVRDQPPGDRMNRQQMVEWVDGWLQRSGADEDKRAKFRAKWGTTEPIVHES